MKKSKRSNNIYSRLKTGQSKNDHRTMQKGSTGPNNTIEKQKLGKKLYHNKYVLGK